MYEDDAEAPAELRAVLALVFIVITVGAGLDLVMDKPETLLSLHVVFELGLVTFSLGAATYLAAGWIRTQRDVRRLVNTVEARSAERDQWRDRAGRVLEGLSVALDAQFTDWRLTAAERETALMLLKGFSLKRIGRLTDRAERTVRQHSVAVYRKAGVAGRSELAGFFLGDLLLPDAVSETASTASTAPAPAEHELLER